MSPAFSQECLEEEQLFPEKDSLCLRVAGMAICPPFLVPRSCDSTCLTGLGLRFPAMAPRFCRLLLGNMSISVRKE